MGLGEHDPVPLAERVEPVGVGQRLEQAESVEGAGDGRRAVDDADAREPVPEHREVERRVMGDEHRVLEQTEQLTCELDEGRRTGDVGIRDPVHRGRAGRDRLRRPDEPRPAERLRPFQSSRTSANETISSTSGSVPASRSRTPRTPRARAPGPAGETVPDCGQSGHVSKMSTAPDGVLTASEMNEARDRDQQEQKQHRDRERADRPRPAPAKLDCGKASCSGSSSFARSLSRNPMSSRFLRCPPRNGASGARRWREPGRVLGRWRSRRSPVDLFSLSIAQAPWLRLEYLGELRRANVEDPVAIDQVIRQCPPHSEHSLHPDRFAGLAFDQFLEAHCRAASGCAPDRSLPARGQRIVDESRLREVL